MSKVRSLGILVCGLTLIVALAGCDSGKDMQITTLQDKVSGLEQRNYDLQTLLAAAMSDADEARRWAAQLQQELVDARGELASVETLPEGWQPGEGGVAYTDIADDILFDAGKAKLKASGRTKIEEVTRQIQETFANHNIWIVGHTDADPIKVSGWIDNLELSQNRAATVAREMYKFGLDPKHVVAGGQGEFNPKAPNDTKPNKSLNRRVQIIAVQRRGGDAPIGSPAVAEPSTPAEQMPPEK